MEVSPPASRSLSISNASPTKTLLETVQIHLHHVAISPRTMVSSNQIQTTPEEIDDRDAPIIIRKGITWVAFFVCTIRIWPTKVMSTVFNAEAFCNRPPDECLNAKYRFVVTSNGIFQPP